MTGLLGGSRSGTKKKIVNQLLEGKKSLGELSERIGISKQALHKHLKPMKKEGIVEERSVKNEGGKIKKYRIGNYSEVLSIDRRGFALEYEAKSPVNFRFPLLNQIPQEEYRTQVLSYLKKIVQEEKRVTVIVFGSVARGEATWKSDIDALLLSDRWNEEEKERIKDKISDVAMDESVDCSFNPHFKTRKEMDKEEKIVQEIKKDGLIVYTNESDVKIWKEMKGYKNI
ncbi:MAG: nucleotidyltransferase domain-containing protein [Candidatus Aenigmatarchaeota archaeon]